MLDGKSLCRLDHQTCATEPLRMECSELLSFTLRFCSIRTAGSLPWLTWVKNEVGTSLLCFCMSFSCCVFFPNTPRTPDSRISALARSGSVQGFGLAALGLVWS